MKEQETKKGLLAKLQSGKLLEVLVILILAIIVIIILYNAFYKDKEDVSASGKGDYATEQEAKLVSVLSKLDGVGKVQVMISLADEGETVIAYETVQKADGTIVTTPVLVNGEVVVLEKRPPEIAGVLIVAEGAENLARRQKHYKSYRLSLHGFSHYRLIVLDLSNEKTTCNRQGHPMKKIFSKIFTLQEKERKK